jgi:hypothetical protein
VWRDRLFFSGSHTIDDDLPIGRCHLLNLFFKSTIERSDTRLVLLPLPDIPTYTDCTAESHLGHL